MVRGKTSHPPAKSQLGTRPQCCKRSHLDIPSFPIPSLFGLAKPDTRRDLSHDARSGSSDATTRQRPGDTVGPCLHCTILPRPISLSRIARKPSLESLACLPLSATCSQYSAPPTQRCDTRRALVTRPATVPCIYLVLMGITPVSSLPPSRHCFSSSRK